MLATGTRTAASVTAAERAAADNLGSVYLHLDDRAFPVGGWVIPDVAGKNSFHDAALSDVYGSDSKRWTQWPYVNKYYLYRKDFNLVMPRLEHAIRKWAQEALEAEELALGGLLFRITQDPDMRRQLHTLAQAVAKAAGGLDETNEDIAGSIVLSPGYDFPRQIIDRLKLSRAIRQRIAPFVRRQNCDVLSTLFAHPLGTDILRKYAEDEDKGTRYAAEPVGHAQASVRDFRRELAAPGNEDHVWRYPTLVTGGVTALGCHKIPGFTEYAVAIGQVLGGSVAESIVGYAGMAIFCLTLVFTGPAGLAILGAADLALAGTAAGLAYLREREQELGAEGSVFRQEADPIATRPEYADTFLAGAAALLSGIAFFKAAREFRALVRSKPKNIKDVLISHSELGQAARRRITTEPTSTVGRALDDSRGLGSRARFADREPGPRLAERPIRPRSEPAWDTPQNMSAQERRVAATGTQGGSRGPADLTIPPETSPTTRSPALPEAGGAGLAPAQALRPSAAPPPGRSTIVDSSFELTPYQREWRGPAATKGTEKAVGAKLRKATGLTILDTESEAAKTLSVQGQSPPITEPVLLEQPIITDPANPPPKLNNRGEVIPPLGSAQPDYAYLTPSQIEIFEVTQDARFQLIPQNRGTQFRGLELPRGDPHKVIQINKVKYLIKRYPNLPIVYNIQAIGQVPEDVVNMLRTQFLDIQRFQRSIRAKGEFQIILRANQTVLIP